MAKVSVNSSQNKCCHLKCGNQACKGEERNVTCNPSDSVNKLGSCFRFLSDKAAYLTVWKVRSSCWNSGKSTQGFFAILQLLFKLLVESLFQFLELSHFICLAHEHAHSSSTLWSRHRTSKQPWFYRSVYFSACENAMSCSTHFKVFMQRCTTLGERTACLIKPHPTRSQGKTQAFSSVLLCRQSLRRVTLHKICCYKEKGLGRTNNFHRCGDSVPVFCAKITCSWCICECPFIQTK